MVSTIRRRSVAMMNRRGVRGAIGVVLTLSACASAPEVAALTPVPPVSVAVTVQSATPPPIPTVRQVGLRADQFIIPLNEFPLAGFKVAGDYGTATYWRRTFDPLARIGAEYWYIDVSVRSHIGPIGARAAVAERGCQTYKENAGTFDGVGPKSATLVSAPASGDEAFACAYAWEQGDVKFDYLVATRNVVVWVQVSPNRSVTQAAAIGAMVEIARRQIAIIDRVAPP